MCNKMCPYTQLDTQMVKFPMHSAKQPTNQLVQLSRSLANGQQANGRRRNYVRMKKKHLTMRKDRKKRSYTHRSIRSHVPHLISTPENYYFDFTNTKPTTTTTKSLAEKIPYVCVRATSGNSRAELLPIGMVAIHMHIHARSSFLSLSLLRLE